MQKFETLSIYRGWKDGYDNNDLQELSEALTEAVRRMDSPIVDIRAVPKPDGEELQVQIREA